VFDKFVQSTKTKTATGGTGLGLPISQKIILDHKGEIWAVNNAGGGATLTFSIPKDQKPKKKLGEILVEQNLITEEELINTLKSQKETS
jgi:K+-sensing histidine kinase KdpD